MGMGTGDAKRLKKRQTSSRWAGTAGATYRDGRARALQTDNAIVAVVTRSVRCLSPTGSRDEPRVCPHTDRATAGFAPPAYWRPRLYWRLRLYWRPRLYWRLWLYWRPRLSLRLWLFLGFSLFFSAPTLPFFAHPYPHSRTASCCRCGRATGRTPAACRRQRSRPELTRLKGMCWHLRKSSSYISL